MLFMDHVIDTVQVNHCQILIGEKNERRAAFLFEFLCFFNILWIDNPNGCASFKLLLMFNQLPELVVTPRSPLSAHKKKHDRLTCT